MPSPQACAYQSKQHASLFDAPSPSLPIYSIGGNAYTAVVATIHPLMDYSEECLSSLQFANRCRSVQNQPRINYVGTQHNHHRLNGPGRDVSLVIII